MRSPAARRRACPLLAQLRWFIRLRWIAGSAVILGAVLDWQWFQWYPLHGRFAALGAVILAYNVLLYFLARRAPLSAPRPAGARAARQGEVPAERRRRSPSTTWLVAVSWLQILLDLACLTLLVLWSRGVHSPFLGFYVFHMVFACLLLPRRMAYGGATAAMLMLGGGLFFTLQWPGFLHDWLIVGGWAVTLLLTVYLTNQITRSLREQRRRLARQNRRVSVMSQRLKDQQQAMIQHEKMVALGQMAAGVAHEIANPLASMDTLVELMLRHPERGGPARLELLREQARRMKQILQQMTTFAHPAHAHGALLSVNAAVKAALAIIRFDPRMRRVHLVRDLSPEADAVQVDSRGMEQVVVNLVINALDAMENTAAPRLAVRTVCEGGGCLIEVSDNGHGIAPEHLDHIFEPFFTTKPVGKGTGLGLAVSYSLVRRLGGSVEVRSEVGKGSVFAIRWPARAVVSYPRESAAV